MRQMGGFGTLTAVLMGILSLIGAMLVSHGPARAAAAAPSAAAALPNFGNPNVHVPVPAPGRAVNTIHPNHVIGHGTPASCTSAAVVRAVAEGGIITFN